MTSRSRGMLVGHGCELGGADADGAGEDARIGQVVERVAQVDDVGLACDLVGLRLRRALL